MSVMLLESSCRFPTNDNAHCVACTTAVNIECCAVLWTVYYVPCTVQDSWHSLQEGDDMGTGSHQMLQKGSGTALQSHLLGLQADLLPGAGLDAASESATALWPGAVYRQWLAPAHMDPRDKALLPSS